MSLPVGSAGEMVVEVPTSVQLSPEVFTVIPAGGSAAPEKTGERPQVYCPTLRRRSGHR